MTTAVQGKKLNIDVALLGRILDVPICGVRIVFKQQPSIEFLATASKVKEKNQWLQ